MSLFQLLLRVKLELLIEMGTIVSKNGGEATGGIFSITMAWWSRRQEEDFDGDENIFAPFNLGLWDIDLGENYAGQT